MNMPKSSGGNLKFTKRLASTADLSGRHHFDKTAENETKARINSKVPR